MMADDRSARVEAAMSSLKRFSVDYGAAIRPHAKGDWITAEDVRSFLASLLGSIPREEKPKFQPHWASDTDASCFLPASPDKQASTPPDGWQPIATAPKDGTPFIAANWMDAFRAFYDTADEVWICEDDGLWFGQLTHPPTHWMPLPPTPPTPPASPATEEPK